MRIEYADKLLQGDALLYPMQGFYMLHLPLKKPIMQFQKAIIGERVVVLIAEKRALIVGLNKNVASILAKQVKACDKKPKPVLGVLTKLSIEESELEEVSFVYYESIGLLEKYLSAKQIAAMNKTLEEEGT